MEFEWDEGKKRRNEAKHGLNFEDADLVFDGTCLSFRDLRFDYDEPRFITVGYLGGRMVVIAHTHRADKTRIISMRKANSREQKIYQERFRTLGQDDR